MKKRFPAILLALCLCVGLLAPSFAAEEDVPPLPTVTVELPGGGSASAETAEYRLRQFTVKTQEGSGKDGADPYDIYTYNEEPSVQTLAVTTLPMGASIQIDGTRPEDGGWFSVGLNAWSDLNEDGVYEARIFRWQPDYVYNCNEYSLIPWADRLYDESRFSWRGLTTTVEAELFGFPSVVDSAGTLISSSDDLFRLFGPNTLIRLTAWYAGTDEGSERYAADPVTLACFLITGEGAIGFTDVPARCALAVDWAVNAEITDGVGNDRFAPDDICKNTEILTFLWRAAGKPASAAQLPDGAADDRWYSDALRWAAGKGMLDDSFVPGAYCTRADAVKYIWQAFDSPDAPSGSGFPDAPAGADRSAAVDWAVANGVANGYPDNTFRPDSTCTRAEIVTFLHRAYVPEVRLNA